MSNSPKVSVCIPLYNHGKYIASTIESILKQTMQDFEIVISDDCSSDDSVKIVKSFQDSRIKLIENIQNQGCSINLDNAISKSCGQYIAIIGSDDIMHQSRLEKQINFLEKNLDFGAVFSYAQTINEKGQEIKHGLMGMNKPCNEDRLRKIRKFFDSGNFFWAPTAMIKNDVLKSVGNHNPCLLQTQDLEMWLKILIKGFDIGVIEEKLTYYRISDGSLSYNKRAIDKKLLSRMLFENRKVLEVFLDIKNLDELKKIFPEIDQKYKEFNENLLSYYLAKEFLDYSDKLNFVNRVSYRGFAIDTLYQILQSKETGQYLKDNFSFGWKEFFALTSEDVMVSKMMEGNINLKRINKKSFQERIINSLRKKIIRCKNHLNFPNNDCQN
jgi:glycosyltransferase involved in cell wall biosynthesis